MKSIKWLFGYAWILKWRLPVSMVLFVITGVLLILTTYLQRWLIDDVFLNGHYDLLLTILGLMALGAVMANTFHACAGLMMARNDFIVRKKLVLDYKSHMNRLPAEEIQKERVGRILHTINTELPQTASLITQKSYRMIREWVQIIVLSVIICSEQPYLWGGLVVISAVYVWIGKVSFPQAEAIHREKMELRSRYSVQLEEGISSTREVIAFNRQEWERNKLFGAFSAYFKKAVEEMKWKNRQMFVTEPVQWLPILFVMGYGGYSVLSGGLTLGLFIVLFQFSRQLLNGMSSTYHLMMELPEEKALVNRVRSKFGAETMKDGDKTLGTIHQLSLHEVSFRYGEEQNEVLKNVSIDIPVGKKVAIVGASGGGKSTIAKLLMRYIEPQRGAMIVNGNDIADVRRPSWYEKIAYVPQEPYLLPESILMNITLGRERITADDVQKACRIAQIHDWIESLPEQYNTLVGERGIQLSGGQRQRIAIARAIVEEKEILVLDEATSALDQSLERELQAALDAAWNRKTMIIIAHRLSTVLNADEIIVMSEGSVIDMGTHDELMRRCEVYSRLVHTGDRVAQIG